MKCACDLLLLILKSFGPLIKVTVSTPVGAKVDLIREERYVDLGERANSSDICLLLSFTGWRSAKPAILICWL